MITRSTTRNKRPKTVVSEDSDEFQVKKFAKSSAKTRQKKIISYDESLDEFESEPNVFEVEMILSKKQHGRRYKYLVKWKHFPDSENTWESKSNLNCPKLLKEFERKWEKDNNEPGMKKEKMKEKLMNEKKVDRPRIKNEHFNNISSAYNSRETEQDFDDFITKPNFAEKHTGNKHGHLDVVNKQKVDKRKRHVVDSDSVPAHTKNKNMKLNKHDATKKKHGDHEIKYTTAKENAVPNEYKKEDRERRDSLDQKNLKAAAQSNFRRLNETYVIPLQSNNNRKPDKTVVHSEQSNVRKPDQMMVHSEQSNVRKPDKTVIHPEKSKVRKPDKTMTHSEQSNVRKPDKTVIHSEKSNNRKPDKTAVHSEQSNVRKPDKTAIHSDKSNVRKPGKKVVCSEQSNVKKPHKTVMHSEKSIVRKPDKTMVHSEQSNVRKPEKTMVHSEQSNVRKPDKTAIYSEHKKPVKKQGRPAHSEVENQELPRSKIRNQEIPKVQHLQYFIKSTNFPTKRTDGKCAVMAVSFKGTDVLRGLERFVETGIAVGPLPDVLYNEPIRTGVTQFTFDV